MTAGAGPRPLRLGAPAFAKTDDPVELAEGVIRIAVTEVPEGGKATEAARVALARALGVAKSRLTLVRGATSRDKLFRLD